MPRKESPAPRCVLEGGERVCRRRFSTEGDKVDVVGREEAKTRLEGKEGAATSEASLTCYDDDHMQQVRLQRRSRCKWRTSS